VLAWSDEFSGPIGSSPDARYWTACTDGRGGGNRELQYYIPEAAVSDGEGHLVLTADRDTGRHAAWYGPSRFTSGKVWTKGRLEFQYGYLEVAASLPAGQPGAWPAIWLLGANYDRVGWPLCGEIDVMESFGITRSPRSVSCAIHSGTDHVSAACDLAVANDATRRHVYSLDWRPDSLEFAVDGTVYQAIHAAEVLSWPFRQPFFLILNLAVGGSMGGEVPPGAALPYRMTVDYVRLDDAQIVRRSHVPPAD
jgi:beta-glucanase (GH16 family)